MRPHSRLAFSGLVLGAIGSAYAASIYDLKKDFVNLRFAMFIHFNMATYEDENTQSDYGSGHADPALFHPTALNTAQWAAAAKSAGMAAGCLTVKHHDGFSLYNSAYSDYDVGTAGPDVVRAYVDAFRSAGLEPGLYFSMWDFHADINSGTVTADKRQFIKNQLRELLTQYGPIPFLVFDGWNAPWGGPTYAEVPYEEIRDWIRALQPDCLIVNISSEANESHADVVMFENGAGQRTPDWYAKAGVDCYQVQKGFWFWKTSMPNGELNSVDFIVNQNLIPMNKQNQVYIVNCAPNPSGTLDANVVQRLAEIGKAWSKPAALDTIPATWYPDYAASKNLAYGKICRQSSTYQGAYASRASDGYLDGRWERQSMSHTGSDAYAWWEVDLGASAKISSVEVWNRTDTEMQRLGDYWIFASDAPFADTDTPPSLSSRSNVLRIHQSLAPNPSFAAATLSNAGGPFQARYVRVQLNGTNYLALSEVKVFGTPLTTSLERKRQARAGNKKSAPVFSADTRVSSFIDTHSQTVDALARRNRQDFR
jgi:alpha-L-fucosidase